MLQRRSFLLVLFLFVALFNAPTVFSQDDGDEVSLDDSPDQGEDSKPTVDTATEYVEAAQEQAAEQVEHMQEAAQNAAESVSETAQQVYEDTKETVEAKYEEAREVAEDVAEKAADRAEEAKEAAGNFVDETQQKASDTIAAMKGEKKEEDNNSPSVVEKAKTFVAKLNKKKVAGFVLGAWGVSVGVGWLSSRANNDATPVKPKGQ